MCAATRHPPSHHRSTGQVQLYKKENRAGRPQKRPQKPLLLRASPALPAGLGPRPALTARGPRPPNSYPQPPPRGSRRRRDVVGGAGRGGAEAPCAAVAAPWSFSRESGRGFRCCDCGAVNMAVSLRARSLRHLRIRGKAPGRAAPPDSRRPAASLTRPSSPRRLLLSSLGSFLAARLTRSLLLSLFPQVATTAARRTSPSISAEVRPRGGGVRVAACSLAASRRGEAACSSGSAAGPDCCTEGLGERGGESGARRRGLPPGCMERDWP